MASPFDLSWEHLAEFPMNLGEWQGSAVAVGPEILEWFDDPDVTLRRVYNNGRGDQIWLSFFGSRGRKSYTLFEHTPATSYPAAGWTLLDSGVEDIPVRRGQLYVQKAVLEKDGERRVALYWYLWNDPRRDPQQGLYTVRMHIVGSRTEAESLSLAADLISLVFPEALPWQRF